MKRLKVAFILAILLTAIELQGFCQVKGEIGDVNFTVRMAVTYSNKRTRVWNFTEDEQSVSLFMNTTWQSVQLVNHSYPIKSVGNDDEGNPIAVVQFPKSELTPGENLSYTVTYHVLSKPRILPSISEEESQTLNEIPNDLKEKYTKAEGPWLTNDTALQDLACNIAGNETKVLTIVKNFAAWIANESNIRYETHDSPLYPNETLELREGDCDDKAILLITLCRIYGIPSYLQIGCIYNPITSSNETYWQGHVTVISKRVSWHGWAIVYIPPWEWLPVDLTYVLGDTSDPLNTIKKAAVTWQWVIQYMNFAKSDYVASSRKTREFLQQNGFYIYEEDEMTMQFLDIPWQQIIETLRRVLIIGIVVGTATLVMVTVFLYVQRTGKRELTRNQLANRLRKHAINVKED